MRKPVATEEKSVAGATRAQGRYRLVTRSDFDGVVCAVLLAERGLIGDIKFVHPKDMQDGKIEITARDVTTSLPYVAAATSRSTITGPKPCATKVSASIM